MRPVRPVWLSQRMKVPPSSSHTYTPFRWQWIRASVKSCRFSHSSQQLCFSARLQRAEPGGLCKHLQKGNRASKMPASICGSWEMVSNVNMEGYMIALGKFFFTSIEDFCMMHCQKKHDHIAVLLRYGDPHCSSQTITLQVLALTWERSPWSWRWRKWLSRRGISVSSKPAAPFGTTPSPSEWDRTLRSSHRGSTTSTSRWPNKIFKLLVTLMWHVSFLPGGFKCSVLCSLALLQSLVTWQGNKLVCEQIGEKKNRGWAHWIEDDKLLLVRQWTTWHFDSSISFQACRLLNGINVFVMNRTCTAREKSAGRFSRRKRTSEEEE